MIGTKRSAMSDSSLLGSVSSKKRSYKVLRYL